METIFFQRIEALRALMLENGWDIVIITGSDPHGSEYPAPRWQQVKYLSGFTGEAGDLVITHDHAGLWTDTRYFIQATRQLEGSGAVLHKTRVPEEVPIPQWIGSLEMESPVIAVDELCWSPRENEALLKAVPDARIIPVPDILAPLWPERPGIPVSPIITIGEDICGESRESKLQRLRKWIALSGHDGAFISSLDSIAWLLNVRGSDIEYNPFVISYLLVTLEDARWFVTKDNSLETDSETELSFEELSLDGIQIQAYSAALDTLAALREDGLDIVTESLPVEHWKACKNEVEEDGFREAHLEDGLAMERFLFWLEENAGKVNEWDAACRLGELRSAIPGYRGDSFETISAYGENAALPHYITPKDGGALIQAKGLYLVDSGGQYLFGTTDITRTVPMGPCTPLEKEDYTLVLKGHLALAAAVFPAGTPGCRIDALAREPLWQFKRNFGHGTGHGVGFFLGVHEGPQDIRQNMNDEPLLPGMVCSDEPGIYREGMHGVRHENLLLCRSCGENEFGKWLCFENLTLCHIDTSCIEPSLLSPQEKQWLNSYNSRVFKTLSPRLEPPIARWLQLKTLPLD